MLCAAPSRSVVSDFVWPHGLQPPGSSVHGVLQARTLEWVAMPFSRGSFQPRDRTQVSRIAGGFFTAWATRKHMLRESVIDTAPTVTSLCSSCLACKISLTWYLSFSFVKKLGLHCKVWVKREWFHSHQDSMVLAQRQKYRSMEQNRKPRDKSTYLRTPYLRQRRQECTMEKRPL